MDNWQIFYLFLTVVALGWAGWMTLTTLDHGRVIARLVERCEMRCGRVDEMTRLMARLDRNVVRLGARLGLDEELEKGD